MSIPYSTTCAVSIKMIRSTKTTSTNGVTLISDNASVPRPGRRLLPFDPTLMATNHSPRRLFPKTSLSKTSLGQVDELEREVVHARSEFLQHVSEIVIEDGCRDGREEPHGSRKKRLRDSRTDRCQTGSSRRP